MAKKHQKAISEKSFPNAEEGTNVLTYSTKKCLHSKLQYDGYVLLLRKKNNSIRQSIGIKLNYIH